MTQPSVGFIGTGVMGASMVRHLLAAGHPAYIFNRSKDKAQALLDVGASWCEGPAEVAARAATVISIVGTPADVRSIYLGPNGLIAHSKPGALLIDMTSSDPLLSSEIAAIAKEKGILALDAPVSGGDIGARNATLSIMVGGEETAFQRALPVLQRLGKTIVHQGPAGAGQYTKLCNQVAIASTMLSVCESMALAQKSGLDPSRVLESISVGAAGSWALTNLMPRALRGDFEPGFSITHFTKDLAIAIECAGRLGLDLPGLSLAKRLYDGLRDDGSGSRGTQALLRLYLADAR
jgi:3-hydroxyisobutyrate dehydrogenase